MKVMLDTSVAGYLVVANPAPGQEQQHKHARGLIFTDHELLLPTPALTEVMAIVPAEKREDALRLLMQIPNLTICSYDTEAAMTATGLMVKDKASKHPWQHVKVDAQIVACAFRYGADVLCAIDGDHERLVTRGPRPLEVCPPTALVNTQEQLF